MVNKDSIKWVYCTIVSSKIILIMKIDDNNEAFLFKKSRHAIPSIIHSWMPQHADSTPLTHITAYIHKWSLTYMFMRSSLCLNVLKFKWFITQNKTYLYLCRWNFWNLFSWIPWYAHKYEKIKNIQINSLSTLSQYLCWCSCLLQTT